MFTVAKYTTIKNVYKRNIDLFSVAERNFTTYEKRISNIIYFMICFKIIIYKY